jgi:hypothetical protein
MPYVTRITPFASQQIRAWGLSEPVWMEVLLHLHQTLAENPQAVLHSLPTFPGAMLDYFAFPDLERPDFTHEFVFEVVYLADEQHLFVLRGSYWRHTSESQES